MLSLRTILGGVFAVALAVSAGAEPSNRPFARKDAAALTAAAETARLAAFRAVLRPAHMIRYPVAIETRAPTLRPEARDSYLPQTRWAHKDGHALWTRAALSAVEGLSDLESVVPRDIERWCPAYEDNSPAMRRAFWVGMMSSLAKHESTYNPRAVGGPNLWYGLLQIYPPTARGYGCYARTGEALKDPANNLACAARIMQVTVNRDQAVAIHDGRWRGVAADWGPMTNRSKIADMARWTSQQPYCEVPVNMRPAARPGDTLTAWFTPIRPLARPIIIATVSTMGGGTQGTN